MSWEILMDLCSLWFYTKSSVETAGRFKGSIFQQKVLFTEGSLAKGLWSRTAPGDRRCFLERFREGATRVSEWVEVIRMERARCRCGSQVSGARPEA
ncbi:MAG: hypothetical protein XD51_0272 [Moorella sp. 60_41]|nr:MAG: hypothetical protein XD51_0272 [Moorella sp. 60_41]